MDILEFLKQIRSEKRELRLIMEREEELRLSLLPAAIRYDVSKVQVSPIDRTPEMMAVLAEYEAEEDRHKAKLLGDITLANKIINRIQNPDYRKLLKLRYIDGAKPLTWEQIADILEYSASSVRGYLHGRAIAQARRIWNEEIKS